MKITAGERYRAYKYTFRISRGADMGENAQDTIRSDARSLAIFISKILATDGGNISYNDGMWKGTFEAGATLEFVTRDENTNETMDRISVLFGVFGYTSFATVETTTAFELYE